MKPKDKPIWRPLGVYRTAKDPISPILTPYDWKPQVKPVKIPSTPVKTSDT